MGEVVEINRSCSHELLQAAQQLGEQLDAAGRVTGFAIIVFAENAQRQQITQQVFSVPNLTLAIGAAECLKADLVDTFREAEGHCPECGS